MANQDDLVHCLEQIVQFEIPPIFRRQHLNRDVIIGLIGDRGDGKSLGGAVIAIVDYMLQLEPCYSNMDISVGFDVDDMTADKYGLQPGLAKYQSTTLDMPKFLSGDSEQEGGVVVIDEINIALADARRAMANQNLAADDAGQQLRKTQSALIYTCIAESFVDIRIRDMTDIYIQTRDTALSPEGLALKKPQGKEFEWSIYPMSRKLTGERYQDTNKALPPVYLKGDYWWGAIDTRERQKRQKYNLNTGNTGVAAELQITKDPQLVKSVNEWEWLERKAIELRDSGYTEIYPYELWAFLELNERGLSPSKVMGRLKQYGIYKLTNNAEKYTVSQFSLKSMGNKSLSLAGTT